jgi:putative phosphoribosyl transferase
MSSLSTPITTESVRIPIGSFALDGDFTVPERAKGVVILAHGSGSSRHSKRNRHVAAELQGIGLATLLMDLLTQEEERVDDVTGHLRFDIGMLAGRLALATDWLARRADARDADGHDLPIGYFGASTGGGAALVAAAARAGEISAVVSRGGRPDLAGDALPYVTAPTLLIVGGNDKPVIAMNEEAMAQLRCEKSLQIIPGATHLFEESGALEEVAHLAGAWFTKYLARANR